MKKLFDDICRLAVDATNAAFGGRYVADADTLWHGKKNVNYAISISRGTAIDLLHNAYGVKYRQIALLSGCHIGSVMRCVRRFQDTAISDPFIAKIRKDVLKMLLKEL